MFIALGILLCYIMGRNLVWNWLALAAALFLFPFTFGLYFIPESPPWLIYNDEEDLAFKAWSLFKRKIIHCFSNFLTVRQPFKRKSICRRNFWHFLVVQGFQHLKKPWILSISLWIWTMPDLEVFNPGPGWGIWCLHGDIQHQGLPLQTQERPSRPPPRRL